jgi:hypothetical protein
MSCLPDCTTQEVRGDRREEYRCANRENIELLALMKGHPSGKEHYNPIEDDASMTSCDSGHSNCHCHDFFKSEEGKRYSAELEERARIDAMGEDTTLLDEKRDAMIALWRAQEAKEARARTFAWPLAKPEWRDTRIGPLRVQSEYGFVDGSLKDFDMVRMLRDVMVRESTNTLVGAKWRVKHDGAGRPIEFDLDFEGDVSIIPHWKHNVSRAVDNFLHFTTTTTTSSDDDGKGQSHLQALQALIAAKDAGTAHVVNNTTNNIHTHAAPNVFTCALCASTLQNGSDERPVHVRARQVECCEEDYFAMEIDIPGCPCAAGSYWPMHCYFDLPRGKEFMRRDNFPLAIGGVLLHMTGIADETVHFCIGRRPHAHTLRFQALRACVERT